MPYVAVLLAAWMIATVAPGVRAAEPVKVSVEGRAEADPARSGQASDEAIEDALVEAVLAVARELLRAPLLPEQEEELRVSLAPIAADLVLTYRIEPGGGPRGARGAADRAEYVVPVTATVDAARLRSELETLGLLREAGARPSVLLRVRSVQRAWLGAEDPRLEPLERAVRQELQENGFVVLDPGVLPGSDPESRSAHDLARETGADVGVEIRVNLKSARPGGRLSGVVAEVRAVAIRVADGSELARMRLDTPAYHADPAEASMRALEAVEEPLARNLRVQLEQNWTALAGERRGVELVIRGVTRLAQVEAIAALLREGLGIDGVELRVLAPALAEFALHDAPAPAALQARLTQADLEAIRLESLAVSARRLELVIREH